MDKNVLSKTPEEIKKWMEYCHSSKPCIDCKYEQRDFPHCVRRLLADAINGYEKLESRLAQVERERDAAVADWKRSCLKGKAMCRTCKFCEDGSPCLSPTPCEDGERWEWRGPCPENTKEASQ